jgi:hypothetical protein
MSITLENEVYLFIQISISSPWCRAQGRYNWERVGQLVG